MSNTSKNNGQGEPEGGSDELVGREGGLRDYIGIGKDESPADLHQWLAELRDEE